MTLVRNKVYTKKAPDKEGKLYFIFCEGEKRETFYFHFFNQIASQIIIQVVEIEDGKNSPIGLYKNACRSLVVTEENPNPQFTLDESDEVWFIVDTDKWGNDLAKLREFLQEHSNWFIAQSNPCFEVWLYYHFINDKPDREISNWKEFVNEVIKGGFDTRKHPAYLETAIKNSKDNYQKTGEQPAVCCTELFMLAEKFLPLVKEDLDALLAKYAKLRSLAEEADVSSSNKE